MNMTRKNVVTNKDVEDIEQVIARRLKQYPKENIRAEIEAFCLLFDDPVKFLRTIPHPVIWEKAKNQTVKLEKFAQTMKEISEILKEAVIAAEEFYTARRKLGDKEWRKKLKRWQKLWHQIATDPAFDQVLEERSQRALQCIQDQETVDERLLLSVEDTLGRKHAEEIEARLNEKLRGDALYLAVQRFIDAWAKVDRMLTVWSRRSIQVSWEGELIERWVIRNEFAFERKYWPIPITVARYLESFKSGFKQYKEHYPLGVCRYCRAFFCKKRKDERYCSPTHKVLHWKKEARKRKKQVTD